MGLGIMQGRLCPPEDGRFQSFPRAAWRDEFARAAAAGLVAIEWIWDAYGADINPIASDEGITEVRVLSQTHGVAVRSICADYFMDYPLVRIDGAALAERQAALGWLIGRAKRLGVTRIVLPFVDVSRIENQDDHDRVVMVLAAALPAAREAEVELHLETSLGPSEFAELLARLPDKMIRVNYDSGNSASLGYHPAEEFAAYGPRVGSVHIKDRRRNGGTVPLGTGDADFVALAAALRGIGYAGDFILQAARGAPGDEVEWSQTNRRFAESHGLIGTHR